MKNVTLVAPIIAQYVRCSFSDKQYEKLSAALVLNGQYKDVSNFKFVTQLKSWWQEREKNLLNKQQLALMSKINLMWAFVHADSIDNVQAFKSGKKFFIFKRQLQAHWQVMNKPVQREYLFLKKKWYGTVEINRQLISKMRMVNGIRERADNFVTFQALQDINMPIQHASNIVQILLQQQEEGDNHKGVHQIKLNLNLNQTGIDTCRIGNVLCTAEDILTTLNEMVMTKVPECPVLCQDNIVQKHNYYVQKPWDHFKMQPLHISMQNPKYKPQFYASLNSSLIDTIERIGQGNRITSKGKIKPVDRTARCVPTGYDIIGERNLTQQFQFSKSFKNLVYGGSCRLFVSKVVADPKYMDWARPVMQAIQQFYVEGYKANRQSFLIMMRQSDPIAKIIMKKNYKKAKKLKYLMKIVQQGRGRLPRQKVYQSFVKSGQIYTVKPNGEQPAYIDDLGFIHGVKQRPRMIQNSLEVGLIQIFQGPIFFVQKFLNSSFIQGLTKKQLKSVLKKFVSAYMKSVSKDGSAFQGNQKKLIRDFIMVYFWPFFEMILSDTCDEWMSKYPQIFTKPKQQYMSYFKFSLTNFDNYTVFPAPGIDLTYTEDMRKAKMASSYSKLDQRDVCVIPFCGGTPSGDATGTTLLNTVFSDVYQCLYFAQVFQRMIIQNSTQLQKKMFGELNWKPHEMIGLFQDLPILSKEYWLRCRVYDDQFKLKWDYFFMEAGDDTVAWMNDQMTEVYVVTVKRRTSSNKSNEISVGMGQVIDHDQIRVSSFQNIDFCSKIAFSDGTVQGWNLYRNPQKTLRTKQYYFKQNEKIFQNPAIHPFALLQGIKAEKMSRLIEAILEYRVSCHLVKSMTLNREQMQYIDEKLQYTFEDQQQNGYQFENEINRFVGLDLYDLYKLYYTHQLYDTTFTTVNGKLGQHLRENTLYRKMDREYQKSVSSSTIMYPAQTTITFATLKRRKRRTKRTPTKVYVYISIYFKTHYFQRTIRVPGMKRFSSQIFIPKDCHCVSFDLIKFDHGHQESSSFYFGLVQGSTVSSFSARMGNDGVTTPIYINGESS